MCLQNAVDEWTPLYRDWRRLRTPVVMHALSPERERESCLHVAVQGRACFDIAGPRVRVVRSTEERMLDRSIDRHACAGQFAHAVVWFNHEPFSRALIFCKLKQERDFLGHSAEAQGE